MLIQVTMNIIYIYYSIAFQATAGIAKIKAAVQYLRLSSNLESRLKSLSKT